jgi:protein zwilch
VVHEEKSLKQLVNRHNVFAAGISSQNLEIQIENIFELTPDITIKFVNNLSDENSSLSSIDKFTEVYLYQQVEIERRNEMCRELWEQIILLHAIQLDIVRFRQCTGDGTLVEPSYAYGQMSYERLQERVNHVLSDVVTIDDREVGDTGLEAVVKRVYTRPLTEVTDQLWDLLKFASSYTDLKRIITFVFQISSRSCIVNIPMNNNRMGELIRELSHQRLAIPHLTSTEPMELLLEIGLEKVMRDYEYIFSESKICMLADINIGEAKITKLDNRFSVRKSLASSAIENQGGMSNRKTLLHGVGTSPDSLLDDLDEIRNSRFSERESSSTISKLAQIHLTIEHLLLIQSHLNLENDYTAIAKKKLERPLMSFEELQKQKFDKFEIPILDKNVAQLVAKLIPNAQKVTMRSENKFKGVESVFYFNIEQIVPSLIQKENEDDQAPVDKKGNSFHFLSYANVTSKF